MVICGKFDTPIENSLSGAASPQQSCLSTTQPFLVYTAVSLHSCFTSRVHLQGWFFFFATGLCFFYRTPISTVISPLLCCTSTELSSAKLFFSLQCFLSSSSTELFAVCSCISTGQFLLYIAAFVHTAVKSCFSPTELFLISSHLLPALQLWSSVLCVFFMHVAGSEFSIFSQFSRL